MDLVAHCALCTFTMHVIIWNMHLHHYLLAIPMFQWVSVVDWIQTPKDFYALVLRPYIVDYLAWKRDFAYVIKLRILRCGNYFLCASVLRSVQLFASLWTVAHQALLSMKFPRQEYQSGLPVPTPEDFPDPEIEPESLVSSALAGTTVPPGKPWRLLEQYLKTQTEITHLSVASFHHSGPIPPAA